MYRISKHISAKEGCHSNTATRKGIKNIPNKEQLEAMQLVAKTVFEPLREFFNVAIGITSFFRSSSLNTAIGGSKTSGHCLGNSIDMDADVFGVITNAQIFNYIKDNLEFDQLIWEYGDDKNPNWVHASYKASGNRNMILKVKRVKGKPVYTEIKK